MNTKKINNKGIYSLFSSFILIVMVIVILLFMVYMGFNAEVEARIVANQTTILKESNTIKNQIMDCWKEITYTNLGEQTTFGNNNCLPKTIPGYAINTLPLLGCKSYEANFGDVSKCNKKTSYYIHVIDEKGQKCLSQLLICFGD